MKVLRNLSLHGNPIYENFAATDASGYRLSVIEKLPWLRSFDFVTVTRGERLAIANDANKLSARGLRRRQRLLEQGAGGAHHPPAQPHHSDAGDHTVSGTHKLVHTLQRIHISKDAGEHPEKIVTKPVIDTGRN